MFLLNCDIKHLIWWQRCYFLSVVWVICFQTGIGPKPLRVLPLEQGLESAKASPWMLFGRWLHLNEMQGDWKAAEPRTELGREVSHHLRRSHKLDSDLPQVAHALNSPTMCHIHFIYLFCSGLDRSVVIVFQLLSELCLGCLYIFSCELVLLYRVYQ